MSCPQIDRRVKEILDSLIRTLSSNLIDATSIIKWASPVICFGDITKSTVATVGLNPSDLEFVDSDGNELINSRRFLTLSSLGLDDWTQIEPTHLDSILQYNLNYFENNPYKQWFDQLDYLISGTSHSYYFPYSKACHLDLIPFATSTKWGSMSSIEKRTLLQLSGNSLAMLLKESPVEYIILNGMAVVEQLQLISGVNLNKSNQTEWDLNRSDSIVRGTSYEGEIQRLGEVDLDKSVAVLGYNLNIQSSFGVSSMVRKNIKTWIENKIN